MAIGNGLLEEVPVPEHPLKLQPTVTDVTRWSAETVNAIG
jgi:hypothetical protein